MWELGLRKIENRLYLDQNLHLKVFPHLYMCIQVYIYIFIYIYINMCISCIYIFIDILKWELGLRKIENRLYLDQNLHLKVFRHLQLFYLILPLLVRFRILLVI
jgi:hypothetical protein